MPKRAGANAPKMQSTVLIVGAGPVGLLIALRLGQAGIDTLLIESHPDVLPATRAMVYMPVINPVLNKLGIMDAIQKEAFLNQDGIMWRDIDGKPLAHLPLAGSDPREFGGVLLLGQYKMAVLLLAELAKYPSVQVCFGLKCVGMEDLPSANTVKVMASSVNVAEGDFLLEAKYVIGADGANSSVRRICCIPFEGFTYPGWKMIGTDVAYDFIAEEGFTPVNFVVHPQDWAVIAYSGQDAKGVARGCSKPLWRVAYVEPPDLPDGKDDYVQRARERVKTWIKNGKTFEVLRAEPYVNHQRCAAHARKGRVLLAGDALHSNNPIGGLGLTTGILDAFAYGNALTRVLTGGEPDSLLTDCANSRRATFLETTNALSQANLRRLNGFDEESVAAREEFFHKLKCDATFAAAIRAGLDNLMPESFEKSKVASRL